MKREGEVGGVVTLFPEIEHELWYAKNFPTVFHLSCEIEKVETTLKRGHKKGGRSGQRTRTPLNQKGQTCATTITTAIASH